MKESEFRLGENKRNILIGVAVLVLVGVFALISYFGVADKDITQDITQNITQEEAPVFQTTNSRLIFTHGEVKINTPDVDNFILASANLEGRIMSEPVRNVDLYEFVVAFPKADGENVETIVTLPAGEDESIGVVVANNGIIGDDETNTITHNTRFISEVIPLINLGEPIQVHFQLQEISDELREQVMSNSLCQKTPESRELCRSSLDAMGKWYANNRQLVEAVESGDELPNNHRIGEILELIIFDDK